MELTLGGGAPLTRPFERSAPQGFGPIPPWWLDRQSHAGTYDEAWRTTRAPRLSEDFDYRFFQIAHPSLIVPALDGDETVALDHLTPSGAQSLTQKPIPARVV